MKKFFSNLLHVLGIIILIIVVVTGIVGCTMYQFHVYQKKHGKQMTFFDWLMDSETK